MSLLDRLGDPLAPTLRARVAVGLRTFPVALGFLARRPRLWPWAALPVVLAGAAIAGAGAGAWLATAPLLAWVTGLDGVGSKLAVAVLPALLAAVVVAGTTVALYFTVNWFAVPFHEALSERVEAEVGAPHPPQSWGAWLRSTGWAIAHSALTLATWLVLFGLGAALQLIPVLGNALGFAIGFGGSAALLARETMDGPMSRREWTFRAKLAAIWRHRGVLLPWGGVVVVLLWIPLLNALVMPVAVVGGTLLFCAIEAAEARAATATAGEDGEDGAAQLARYAASSGDDAQR